MVGRWNAHVDLFVLEALFLLAIGSNRQYDVYAVWDC